MSAKITPTKIKESQSIVPTQLKSETLWSFSFQYFNQIKYFGLDTSEPKWFVSLLERLKDLSSKERSIFFNDRNSIRLYKYHKIDWNSRNIPIVKSEINWVDKHYIENDEDFPFFQFKISRAKGRIVGFWNETNTIFNIVLVDPLHNMQPSKDFNYNVDDCYPLSCEYSSLIKDIEELSNIPAGCSECNIKTKLKTIPTKLNKSRVVMGFLDDDFFENYNDVLEEKSFSEILKDGIINNLK
jgi:hypothetical protein